MNSKKIKVIELILVILIAFWQSIYIAIYTVLSGKPLNIGVINSNYYITAFINAVLAIGLMFYVLYKNGYASSYIGLNFPLKWKDLFHALALYFFSLLVMVVLILTLRYIAPSFVLSISHPKNLEFFHNRNFTAFIILLAIIIPIKEEFIVRGFTMARIFELTTNKYLTVGLSVLIQFSYHLYQGLPSALLLLVPFTTFAVYFSKYRNLNAVVFAHILTDIISTAVFYLKK
jgi:membrane protease YdiL (CAAX protease family)